MPSRLSCISPFMGSPFRPTAIRLITVAAITTSLFTLYCAYNSYSIPSFFGNNPFRASRPSRYSCPPRSWASGSWKPSHKFPDGTKMEQQSDVLTFSGFPGCASTREYYWNLGSDHEELFNRFPAAHSYDWHSDECSIRPFEQDAFVIDLVENGGWLLIGDSVTENHFFSLSCSLYPHVWATPNYTENPYLDRGWPQNLYFNPQSPLASKINFPVGFSIESTPLVTFRRVDLLLDRPDLDSLYKTLYAPPANFTLFSDEAVWTLSAKNYTDLFLTPLPDANYRTMVINTAGHWTTTVFSGLANPEKPGNGIENVLQFFRLAMENWADEVQQMLRRHRNKDVVVRAYLPGHDNCHNIYTPWTEIQEYDREIYNWNWIKDFNSIFEDVLSTRLIYPDIHFLPIDRPARLRPDTHSAGDCLHLLTGVGVLEGWTHYIWHFISRELPGMIR